MKGLAVWGMALLVCGPAFGCDAVSAGGITVANAWSRASVGVAAPGVVYLEMRNDGTMADRLTGISTPAAGMPMLHETVVTDGVASMDHVMGVDLAPGAVVALVPGGLHAMLMGLAAPLAAGGRFPVTLSFERAGDVTVEVDVLPLGATGPAC